MRSFLIAITILCTCLMITGLHAAEKPNVLFIAVDDLNDWIGCLGGHPQCQTPHIDALAARGLLFKHSYCAAPACNPSRAALLTGIRPSTSGVYHNPQPWRPAMPDAITLPAHFKANGYRVEGGGKIYHGRYKDPDSWHHYYNAPGWPKPSRQVLQDPHSKAGGIVWGVLDTEDQETSDYKVVSNSIEFLKKKQDKPFFLACGIFRPHMPWQVPRKYYEMYPLDSIQLPETQQNDLRDVPPAGLKMAKPQGDHATILKTDNWKHAVQAYLASITYADAQIGRLIKALDESEYKENTIVILWGDHGWHLGEKEHWRKFALWEEATRAPLMISAAEVTQPGSVCERTVDFISIYPTLVELCGLAAPKQLEGPSLVPLLKNPNAQWDRPALTTHGRNNHALRSERFRYIQYADGSEELYDHEADPQEWNNLASDPRYNSVKAEFQKWFPNVNVEDAEYDQGLKRSKKKAKQPKAS